MEYPYLSWAGLTTRARRGWLLFRRPWRLRRYLAEIRFLRTSGLLDVGFYCSRYPDVARAGLDPVAHYVVVGASEDREPCALFDPRFYRTHYPEVSRAEANPLLHYARFGAREGRSPHPLFDASYYLAQNPDVARSGVNPLAHYMQHGAAERRDPHPLFDVAFYLAQNPDVATSGVNPLVHYTQHGTAERRSPHPLFDAAFYLAQNPDVAASGVNPLVHYLEYGAAEKRDPHPLFDAAFYQTSQSGPAESNPLVDYVRRGSEGARDPNPLFDTRYYRETCGEVLPRGCSPLEHYVCTGSVQGRSPHPIFDASFYRSHYRDVAEAGIDPLGHFIRDGAREKRNPNPLFDTSFYLDRYPDVDAAGLNALDHYCRFGHREGRDPGWLFKTALYLEENPAVRASRANALAHFLRSLPPGQDPRDAPFAYRSWLSNFDGEPTFDRAALRSHLDRLTRRPILSLIVTSRNGVVLSHLEATVESVRRQLYEAWELVVVLPPAAETAVRGRLQQLAAADSRVRTRMALTSEPWAMLGEGVAGARGEFVVFVEDDALLDHRALLLLAKEIGDHPGAAVVYSDEDRLDPRGRRCSPHFKPDWNRGLFLAWNYLGRLTMLDRRLVEAVGGLRGTFAPSHEYDLLLRVIEEAGDECVRHLPWILCHRRSAGPQGGAGCAEEAESARRALEGHLATTGVRAVVEDVHGRFHRVQYRLPEEPPLVSVIVYDGARLEPLERNQRRLSEKTDYPRFEIRVVRDGQGVSNRSAILNATARQAAGTVLVFLRSDTLPLDSSWLAEMIRLCLLPDVGAVGAKLYDETGRVVHAGTVVGANGLAGPAFAGVTKDGEGYFARAVLTQDFSAVSGDCLAIRRSVFEQVGGFDEDAFPEDLSDVDLCLRVRSRRLRVLLCAQAEMVQPGSPLRPAAVQADDRAAGAFDRFRARWMPVIQNDPCYNPNLDLKTRTFSLATPPRVRMPWAADPPTVGVTLASRLDPYGAVDNWSRAAEIEDASRRAGLTARGWRPGLSIVILTLDRFDLIAPLLDQLVAATAILAPRGLDVEVVVGDTGSTDARVLRKYEALSAQIAVERNLQYHFSRCNNLLFRERVTRDKTLFLNNDIVFASAADSLIALAREIDGSPEVGIAGAPLTYPDGRIQHVGIEFRGSDPLRGLPFHPHHGGPASVLEGFTEARDCRAVTGACLAIRSRLFAELGGFDEEYRAECQDVALCLAAWRHGYRCRLVPAGRVVHHENETRPRSSEDWADRQRLVRRWRSFVEAGLC